jgi:uncharacterized protein (DUF849 family)
VKKLIIEVRVNEYAMRDGKPNVPGTTVEIGRNARAIQDAARRSASATSFPIATRAIAQCGHVSIGIGDYDNSELGQRTNADLVREIVRMARLVLCEIATPAEARPMLAL